METSAGFWLPAVLLVAALSFTEAQTVEKYFKVGGELQLSPQKVSEPIISIVWKYGNNLLAEWEKGSTELMYYSKFKGRSELNTDTGVLVVRRLTAGDTGLYSVEINNKVQSQVYQTVEIQEVPQPEVTVKPLVCNSTWEKCTLSCDGDVRGAEPVTYFWKKDHREWERSENNIMEIFNDKDTQCVIVFSCRMKNPVSEKDSRLLINPFFQIKRRDCGRWILVLGAVMRSLAILALFVVIVSFLCQRLQTVCKSRNDDNAD